MSKRKAAGVEAHPAKWRPAAFDIPDDRVPDKCAMDAKLVGPARNGLEFDERAATQPLYYAEV